MEIHEKKYLAIQPAPGFKPMTFRLVSSCLASTFLTGIFASLRLITLSLLGGPSRGHESHHCSHQQHFPQHIRPIQKVSNGFTNSPELPGPEKNFLSNWSEQMQLILELELCLFERLRRSHLANHIIIANSNIAQLHWYMVPIPIGCYRGSRHNSKSSISLFKFRYFKIDYSGPAQSAKKRSKKKGLTFSREDEKSYFWLFFDPANVF